MDAAAELGRNPVSKHQIQLEYIDEQADAGRNCRTRLARQNFRRERGQGNVNFPCSADHEQDWQPYPVDLYSCYMCDHTIKTCKSSGPTSFSVLGVLIVGWRLCVSGTKSNSIINTIKMKPRHPNPIYMHEM